MAREDGVDLVVLIPPVHAFHLETIRAAVASFNDTMQHGRWWGGPG